MNPLSTREVKALMEALEKLHQEMDLSEFPNRVFEVIGGLIPEVIITAQEFNLRTKTERHATSFPTPPGLIERSAELVPLEHPIFPVMMAGATDAMRLSDFRTLRQLRRTALFQETMQPFGACDQIVLPLRLPDHVAGITINRDSRFTDAEVSIAHLLGPQIALAHIHAQRLTALRQMQREPVSSPGALTALGLTPREAEVLHWIIQGKRDAEIGIILEASERTIQKHVQRILSKLRVETRTAAALEGIRGCAGGPPPAR